jgi:signal transduction histidine kinase
MGSPFVETEVDVPQAEAVDRRTVALLRILLAFVAFSVTLIDPTEPQRFVELTYFLLAAYFVYSILLFIMAGQERPLIPLRWTHWLDVTWFVVITGLSNGPSSIFFFFFMFPIMVASFRWGFAEGMRVTGTCTILFILFAYFFYQSPGAELELNRFLIRPIYLLVFGFMTASWGGREVLYRRRLALFREVSRTSNPRFGIDQTLQSLTDKLRTHFDADLCVLRIENPTPAGKTLWTSQAPSSPRIGNVAEHLNTEYAIVHTEEVGRFREECHTADPATLEQVDAETVDCRTITRALGTRAFISLPLLRHGGVFGVLCVASRRPAFDRTDLEFLYHLLNQVLPNIENTQLLDRLASQAAGQQRQKLSRDLHDTTVQPYIGLKLGLEALELKHDAGQPVGEDIRKLITLADTSIAEIRGFVRSLKGGREEQVGGILVTALRQQATKYREFYGIAIDVEADDHLQVNDRLGAEVFQIIIEGLSNIRRHTDSKRAVVRIARDRDIALRVEIENEPDGASPADEFVPRSITERTTSLGGRAEVLRKPDITRISVEIPL